MIEICNKCERSIKDGAKNIMYYKHFLEEYLCSDCSCGYKINKKNRYEF